MTESEAIEKVNELHSKIVRSPFAKNVTESEMLAFIKCKKALEKQIPKKPIKSENQVVRYVNTYYCPTCELGITGTNIAKWCYHCGQKLDWSDEE